MAKITLDLVSDAQPVIDDWNRLNKTGGELNETTKEFGDVSSKSFKQAADGTDEMTIAVNKYKKEQTALLKEQNSGFERTIKGRKRQVGAIEELNIALKKLKKARDSSQDVKSISKFNKKIEEAQFELKTLQNVGTTAFEEVKTSAKDAGEEVGKGGGAFSKLGEIAGGIGLAFGAGAIIENVIKIGSAVIDTVKHFEELGLQAGKITGLTGESLDGVIIKAEAIGKTFDTDVVEVIKSAQLLSEEFGITQEEALDKIASGAAGVKGGIDSIISGTEEFALQIKNAGGGVDDLFLSIDKDSSTAITNFSQNIREQTKGSRDALTTAFGGGFTDKLFKEINDGTITSVEGLKLVSQELKNSEIPATELEGVISNLFGEEGQTKGLAFIQSLSDIGGGVEDLTAQESELAKQQREILEANEALAASQLALSDLFEGTGDPTFFTNLKTIGFELLISVIEPMIGLFDTLKESFSPLIAAVSELGASIGDTGASFSIMDGLLLPFKITLETLGFVLGLVAQALTFVVQEINEFVKSSSTMTSIINAIGHAFNVMIEQFRQAKDLLTSGFDTAAAAGKKAAREIDKQFTQPILEQLSKIDSTQRENLKQNLIRDQLEIQSKLQVLAAQELLTSEAGRRLIEQAKANKLILDEINNQEKAEIDAIKEGEKEKAKVRDVANKKASAAQAKADADRLKALEKAQKEFDKLLEKLIKDSAKIELDALTGEERFAALRKIREDEIQILEDALKEQGTILAEAKGEEFEFAEKQLEQLSLLRQNAREEEAAAIAKFRADQRLAQLDEEEKTIDISEQVNIEAVEDLEKGDMSEQDFELFKQEQILAIQADFMQQRIDLLEEEIRLKEELFAADGIIDAQEQNQLDSLALQKSGLEKSIDQAEDAQEELASKRAKTSLAEILGMSDEDFEDTKERVQAIAQEVVNGLQSVLSAQTEANEERIDQLDESIAAGEEALDRELELSERGFANNVEGKQAELKALEKQRDEEFKKQKALAKKQFALDTAVQASSLITAAANVLKGFSTIPLVGQILGITQVALMVAAFFASRASALSAINSGGPQAATGASGEGSTGKVHGRSHLQGGERFTDHLEVEGGEKWAILSKRATGKHGDVFERFAMGLNAGRNPDDIMNGLLNGTGVYMKKDIDKKIQDRTAVIRTQEIIMLGNAGNENMEGTLDSMDRNLGELKEFEMNRIQIIEKPGGRIEYNPKTGKRIFIKYVD